MGARAVIAVLLLQEELLEGRMLVPCAYCLPQCAVYMLLLLLYPLQS